MSLLGAILTVISIWQFILTPIRAREERKALIADFHEFEDASYAQLIARYPCGYVVWMRDHQSLVAPPMVRGRGRIEFSTEGSGPTSIEGDQIVMRLPKITDTANSDTMLATVFRVPRERGRVQFGLPRFSWTA